MVSKKTLKVAFIGSFPPIKCGIATFTSDLISNLSLAGGRDFHPLVVAVGQESGLNFSEPVKFEIRHDVKKDYISAADYLNCSDIDLISVQHEFGLYGPDAGSYLYLLLDRVKVPIVTTCHTILKEPSDEYYKSMMDLCSVSDKIIVMNKVGVEILRDVYNVRHDKIHLIPHGIPDLPFVDSNYYKAKFGFENRKTLLTFGLLSRNKGIEVLLKAMPKIIEADPEVLYIILGATHPNVIKYEGQSYREALERLVNDLNLDNNVIFHNQFVSDERLQDFLCAADIYVTPYKNTAQLTSGTLAFAVGAGKAVISTPYWAAKELISDGRGILVDFDDSEGLAEAAIKIINSDKLFYSLRKNAYEYGRSIVWPQIGKEYYKLITGYLDHISGDTHYSDQKFYLEMPEPSLEHFNRLTDDTGILQHAKYTIPNREHGYCTDDNARAVVAMAEYYAMFPDPQALKLLDIYLSFTINAQNEDGMFRNFMNYDRTWVPDEPASDALGRALWAFGAVITAPPVPKYVPIIKEYFDRTIKHVPKLSIRGKAYAIIAMAGYLEHFPGASDIKRYLSIAAGHLLLQYEAFSKADWQWYEDIVTYDNGAIVNAMYIASMVLDNKLYQEVAEKTASFLLEKTFNGNYFSFIGCNGWYRHGGEIAGFDQQAIEAASTAMMLGAAYKATKNKKYLEIQRKAFDWFLGANDLNIAVYDYKTKGCYDGLQQHGVNQNQGAESLISYMMSLLAILQSNKAATDYHKVVTNNCLNSRKKFVPRIRIQELTVRGQLPERTVDKKKD